MIFCTVPSVSEGETISRQLLGKSLVTCCNIIPGLTSIYHWEGQIEKSEEALLMIKSTVQKFEEIEKTILDLHSYDVPEIKKLERTYIYSREGAGSLQVTDEVIFSQPCEFGTALITFSDWKQISPTSLIIQDSSDALSVEIKVTGADFEIRPETIDEDVSAREQPTRLGIDLKKPVTKALVSITITPIKPSGQ